PDDSPRSAVVPLPDAETSTSSIPAPHSNPGYAVPRPQLVLAPRLLLPLPVPADLSPPAPPLFALHTTAAILLPSRISASAHRGVSPAPSPVQPTLSRFGSL